MFHIIKKHIWRSFHRQHKLVFGRLSSLFNPHALRHQRRGGELPGVRINPFTLFVQSINCKPTRHIFQESNLKRAEFYKAQTETSKLQSAANFLSLPTEECGNIVWQFSLRQKQSILYESSLRQEINSSEQVLEVFETDQILQALLTPKSKKTEKTEKVTHRKGKFHKRLFFF